MPADYQSIATSIIRSLTGRRWTYPIREVRELYPSPTGKIYLRGTPVTEVVSVKSYLTGEDINYVQFKNGLLELTNQAQYVCLQRNQKDRVDVTYRYGSKPSAGIEQAIAVLADEMKASDEDSGNCRLPDRVTNVSRQGTSWTLIDPQDFLDNGRTGIIEIDMVLKSKGKARARARVFSPEFPPPQRISSSEVVSP